MKGSIKQPTMADVAKEAGVSSMTVSRAFKDASYINKETRKKIHEAADRIGYLYDSTAAGLSSRKTGFVAVTIPSINNSNFADTIRGLTDGLRESRLQILLGYTGYDVAQEERLIRQFLTRRPEAVILTGGSHTPSCRRLLEDADIPVIETWDKPDQPIGKSIGFSNASLSALLVDHLIDNGRQNIAFLGGDTQRDTRGTDRRRGFIKAMKARGLNPSRLGGAGTAPISMRESAQALAELLQEFPDTDAVVCVSDPAAFGALTQCQRQGIDVPGQLAIAGFGAYDISEVCVPAITTVDPRSYEIGTRAADLVIQMTSGEEMVAKPLHVDIATQLVIRGTTSMNI